MKSGFVLLVCFFLVKQSSSLTVRLGMLHTADSNIFELAARLAVAKINADPQLLPGHFLTLDARNVDSPTSALENACVLIDKGISGLIGPSFSSHAVFISPLFTSHQIPFIAYSATSVLLSDRTVHPYFGRTAPSDSKQAEVIIGIVRALNWTRACILHQDDSYGVGGALATEDSARSAGITIPAVHGFSAQTYNASKAVSDVLEQGGCHLFIVWCIGCLTTMRSIRQAGFLHPGHRQWILSDGCYLSMNNKTRDPGLFQDLVGTLCVVPDSPESAARTEFLQVCAIASQCLSPCFI